MVKLFDNSFLKDTDRRLKAPTQYNNDNLALNLNQAENIKANGDTNAKINERFNQFVLATWGKPTSFISGTDIVVPYGSDNSAVIKPTTTLKDTYNLYNAATGEFTIPVFTPVTFSFEMNVLNTGGGTSIINIVINENTGNLLVESFSNFKIFQDYIPTAYTYSPINFSYTYIGSKGDVVKFRNTALSFNLQSCTNPKIIMKW
jgi:hypothetical protein